jgi:hypothetical protein
MEAVMPSSITRLVVGIAVAFGVAVVSVGPIGSAGAQSPIEIIAQEALTNRFETPLSETDFRLRETRPGTIRNAVHAVAVGRDVAASLRSWE